MKRNIFLFVFLAVACLSLQAQQTDEEYRQVIYGRASKIVAQLSMADEAAQQVMTELIARQYIELGKVNDAYAEKSKGLQGEELDDVKAWQQQKLSALHYAFVSNLCARLTGEQVETVKNGMTMWVLPHTYQAHLDMIPTLTQEEKDYILAALMEAREYAMDCSDSKAKHAWFGKYKGRINNYLSKRGYDLKKEREAWNLRIKAAAGH